MIANKRVLFFFGFETKKQKTKTCSLLKCENSQNTIAHALNITKMKDNVKLMILQFRYNDSISDLGPLVLCANSITGDGLKKLKTLHSLGTIIRNKILIRCTKNSKILTTIIF